MHLFTKDERDAITEAIARAELKTSGEIVVVAARASDGYRAFPLACAALIALAVPLPLIHLTKWPIEYVYLLQLMVFLTAAVILQIPLVRVAITPVSIKEARAHRRAIEQFLVQNLHTTKDRTGVLLYVSFAERYAVVIADDGIYRKVSPAIWEEVIADLTHHLRKGQRRDGFIAAVNRCGAILAEHFPQSPDDADELPNHLIVLDGYGRT
jgi:putative membrane protein